MELLKGAPVSAAIREWAAEEIKQLQGSVPKLAIIRVGEKPAFFIQLYIMRLYNRLCSMIVTRNIEVPTKMCTRA